MTYGDNFNWSFVIDSIFENTFVPMPGADLVRYKKDTFNISEVDAFGTAFTPLGAFDVLRVKNDASSLIRFGLNLFRHLIKFKLWV